MVIGRIDWKSIFENSNFWGVQAGKKAIERAKSKGKNKVTVKCAATPSGVMHIGNANEIIRSYLIAKSIEALGFKSEVIYTSDDRDPFRSIPKTLLDRNGELIKTSKEILEEYRKYFGKPVSLVPDPFDCHSSWSEHFLHFFFDGLKKIGILDSINFHYYSPNVLYYNGIYDNILKFILENHKEIEEFLSKFKEHPVVYNVICENCGRISAKFINFDGEKVEYVCEERVLGDEDRVAEGCGYHGKTSFRYGKLPWNLEWAAQWKIFDVDIEPFGKEHIESYKLSKPIAEEIYKIQAPIPVPYEYFLVNGEKMSSSKGNVYDINYLLKMLEPEIILFFYTKRPTQQRNIDFKNLHLLVEEFERMEERVYRTFGYIEGGGDIQKLKDAKFVKENNYATLEELVIYYLCMRGNIPEEKPVRIPYAFAAIVGQLLKDENSIIEVLKRTGHLKKFDYKTIEEVINRVKRAVFWVRNHGPEYLKVKIVDYKVDLELDERDKQTLKEIIKVIEEVEEGNIEELQTGIHNTIKSLNDPKTFYKKLYRILLDKDAGPKIATLISVIGKEKAIEILSKYV